MNSLSVIKESLPSTGLYHLSVVIIYQLSKERFTRLLVETLDEFTYLGDGGFDIYKIFSAFL